MINEQEFLNNLKLTQSYCSLKIKDTTRNLASILRTIIPKIDNKLIFDFRIDSYPDLDINQQIFTNWNIDPIDTPNILERIFEEQKAIKESLNLNKDGIFDGKILATKYGETVVDGASEFQSYGLVDIYDLPPIDTWIYLDKKTLYSWIPIEIIPSITNAINVNCMDLMDWVEI